MTAALRQIIGKGALYGVRFHTDDLDATVQKVRASGAEVVQEPDRAAVGHAGLCHAWSVRQSGAYRPAARRVVVTRPTRSGRGG